MIKNIKICAFFVCLLLFPFRTLLAQESISVDYKVSGKKIIISYELESDLNSEYEIKLQLRRADVSNFLYIPENLSGDIGEGKYAGGKKEIIWVLTDDELRKSNYQDFYFEVIAEKIEDSKGWPWYYYATGVGVIGSVVALLLLPEDDDPASFPLPPGPPN